MLLFFRTFVPNNLIFQVLEFVLHIINLPKTIDMKRIFVFLITALTCGLGVMAQENLVATLQHGSDIQAFYGANALSEAHEAAVEGDVITLSAGEFNGCNINKAVTVRGEGADKTYLNSYDLYCTIPQGSKHTLSFEGLRIKTAHSTEIKGSTGAEKVVISKCRFILGNQPFYFYTCNATLIQSDLRSESSVTADSRSNVTCLNSIFYRLGTSNHGNNDGRFDVQNCIMIWPPTYSYTFTHSSIKNTIILNGTDFYLDSTCTSSHCLVKNTSGFSDSWTVSSMDGIFTNDYHLSANAAATYIGTDGTQIGIYGGMYPFDLTPSYPLVKKLDVTGSHKNGKLNVKINVE